MNYAKAIWLDHAIRAAIAELGEDVSQVHVVIGPEAAPSAPPPEPELKPDPAAERRAVRDQVLVACADRLDPDRNRSVRSIHGEIKAAFREVNSKTQPSGRGIEPIVWNLRGLRAAGMAKAMPSYETLRRLLVANGWPSPGRGGRYPRRQ